MPRTFVRGVSLSKKADAFFAKGNPLRSAPWPLTGPATLAPRKVFFRRRSVSKHAGGMFVA